MKKNFSTFGLSALALCAAFAVGCGPSAPDSDAPVDDGKKADMITVDVPDEPGIEPKQEPAQDQTQDQAQTPKPTQKQTQKF